MAELWFSLKLEQPALPPNRYSLESARYRVNNANVAKDLFRWRENAAPLSPALPITLLVC